MSDKICLFGAGGHGRVVANQLFRCGKKEVCFGDGSLAVGTIVSKIPVLFNEVTDAIGCSVIVSIGDNITRASIQAEATLAGLQIACFISEHGYYGASRPGEGSMVLAGSVVNTGARIGKGVIVNSGAIVEHDAFIGDFCHLSPGSVVTGGARLGSRVLLGSNATILIGISVAPNTIIGAGAVVTRDIDVAGTYIGVPARKIREAGF